MATTYTASPNVGTHYQWQSAGSPHQTPSSVPMVMKFAESKPNDFSLNSAPTIGTAKFG